MPDKPKAPTLVRSPSGLFGYRNELLAALVDQSDDGIIGASLKGVILNWNRGAERIYGYAEDEAIGKPVALLVPPERRIDWSPAAAQQRREVRRFATVHVTKDGRRIDVDITISPIHDDDGMLVGTSSVVRDRTESYRIGREREALALALKEREEQLRLALESAEVGTWDWNLETGRVSWSDNLEEIHGSKKGSFGNSLESVVNEMLEEDRPAVLAAIQAAQSGGDGRYHVEYRIRRTDGEIAWLEGIGRATFGVDGKATRMSGVCRDVTSRKLAEERQHMLLQELNHRVKNTLAAVQSIAHQTLRGTGVDERARALFEGRLLALSQAHDLLTRDSWQGVELEDLARRVLAPYVGERKRFEIEGPRVRLRPSASVALVMAFHELATNAAKYGALSVPSGRVRLVWDFERGGPPAMLHLSWREHGGPPVRAPARSGFGTRMIERGLSHELDATVRIAYDVAGVACNIDIPLGPSATVGRLDSA